MRSTVILMAAFITIGWLFVFSIIATKVSWFCRGRGARERWETQTPAQRFFGMFIPGFIGFLFLIILYGLGII